MSEYEPFCIYGFRTVYPVAWKVELDSRLERSIGKVTFKSPEKANIVVSWGPLDKAEEKYSSLEEQVRDSINRIKKDSKVKEVELVQTKNIQVNSHKAIFSHFRIIFSMHRLLPFGKSKVHEQIVHSLHLYCKPSRRYFTVYGITTSKKFIQQDHIFENIIKSFVCHKEKIKATNQ